MRSRIGPLALFVLGLLCAFAVAAQAQFTPLCRSGTTGTKNCSGTLAVSHVPTGIPAANIGDGSLTNAELTALAGNATGAANLVLATPNGAAGDVALRKIEFADLALSATARMFPNPSAALANVTICGNGTSWAIVGAAPAGWIYQSGAGGCQWTNALSGSAITFSNIPADTALVNRVPVANGGTDKASWTVGSIPVATAATTIGEIAPGTAGQLLTSNGSGAAPTMQAPVTATTVSATVSTLSLTTNTWEAIPGSSVSLAPGKYLCIYSVRTTVACSAGFGYISVKLRNNTAGSDIATSQRIGAFCGTTGVFFVSSPTIAVPVTVASTSTVQAYALAAAGATYTRRDVDSDPDGYGEGHCVQVSK